MRRRPPDFKANCAVSTLRRRTERLRRTNVDIKRSKVQQLNTASNERRTQGLNAKESTLTLILTSVKRYRKCFFLKAELAMSGKFDNELKKET